MELHNANLFEDKKLPFLIKCVSIYNNAYKSYLLPSVSE